MLRDLKVPRLLVVPHDDEFTTQEPDRRSESFLPEILAAGYKEVLREHKFAGSAALRANGLFPATYFLFEA